MDAKVIEIEFHDTAHKRQTPSRTIVKSLIDTRNETEHVLAFLGVRDESWYWGDNPNSSGQVYQLSKVPDRERCRGYFRQCIKAR